MYSNGALDESCARRMDSNHRGNYLMFKQAYG